MPIDLNGACASMMLGAKSEPELDWLTFTPDVDPLDMHLEFYIEDSPSFRFQIRKNNERWRLYHREGKIGETVHLDMGDRLSIRAASVNEINQDPFVVSSTKVYRLSGNLMSLASSDMSVTELTHFKTISGCFVWLCVTAPYITAKDIPRGFFGQGFRYSRLRNMIEMPNVTFYPNHCFGLSLGDAVYERFVANSGSTLAPYAFGNDGGAIGGIGTKIVDLTGVVKYSKGSLNRLGYRMDNLEEVYLPLLELEDSVLINAFSGLYGIYNHKLRLIKAHFTSWREDLNATLNWVKNVSPTGDFYCPADLPLIWDDSHIPIGWTAHPEGKEPVPYPDPLEDKYLRFTAEQDGSLLRLDKSADVPELNARLEYKINAGNWEEYTWGTDKDTPATQGHLISLPKVGDTVKWRAVGKNETFSVSFGNYYVFSMDKPIACAGNVMSLLDKTCELLTVPKYGFNNLFKKAKITSYPLLPALQMVGAGGYYDLFYNVNTLKDKSIVISIKSFGNNPYGIGYTFHGNTQLNNITVNFPMWPFSAGNSNWVNGVSPHGVFTCPSDLPVIFGDSNIPHGWTVNNGLTEPNEEEILNACYQYRNGQLIIQPDFKACLNRAEQIDYVKHGKTYWRKNTPLPNPHRPELGGGYYKVTNLYDTFNPFNQMTDLNLSEWDKSEVTELFRSFRSCEKLKTIQFKNALSIIDKMPAVFFADYDLLRIDLSSFDFSKLPDSGYPIDNAFTGCTSVTEAYARTQADCDKLNASVEASGLSWRFQVKPPEVK